MTAATITVKGQVTIPKDVRDALGLREHDKVVFVVEGDRAIMRPIRLAPLDQLRGVAKGRAPFKGRQAERAAARKHLAQRIVSSPPSAD